MTDRLDLRTNADRLREAERDGKIKVYHYTYCPTGHVSDTRHVIIDAEGKERVLKQAVIGDFLKSIDA